MSAGRGPPSAIAAGGKSVKHGAAGSQACPIGAFSCRTVTMVADDDSTVLEGATTVVPETCVEHPPTELPEDDDDATHGGEDGFMEDDGNFRSGDGPCEVADADGLMSIPATDEEWWEFLEDLQEPDAKKTRTA